MMVRHVACGLIMRKQCSLPGGYHSITHKVGVTAIINLERCSYVVVNSETLSILTPCQLGKTWLHNLEDEDGAVSAAGSRPWCAA